MYSLAAWLHSEQFAKTCDASNTPSNYDVLKRAPSPPPSWNNNHGKEWGEKKRDKLMRFSVVVHMSAPTNPLLLTCSLYPELHLSRSTGVVSSRSLMCVKSTKFRTSAFLDRSLSTFCVSAVSCVLCVCVCVSVCVCHLNLRFRFSFNIAGPARGDRSTPACAYCAILLPETLRSMDDFLHNLVGTRA